MNLVPTNCPKRISEFSEVRRGNIRLDWDLFSDEELRALIDCETFVHKHPDAKKFDLSGYELSIDVEDRRDFLDLLQSVTPKPIKEIFIHSHSLTDKSIPVLVKFIRSCDANLESVDLGRCLKLTDVGRKELVRGLADSKYVRELIMPGKFTEDVLKCISDVMCTNSSLIRVWSCPGYLTELTDDIQYFCRRNELLQWRTKRSDGIVGVRRHLIDFCVAFSSLELPPYVLLEIFDWLPVIDETDVDEENWIHRSAMHLVPHVRKIRMIESMQRNRKKVLAQRENSKRNKT